MCKMNEAQQVLIVSAQFSDVTERLILRRNIS